MVKNQSVDNVCDLPIELLELIMTYISYDEIAKTRSVCRLFDNCSQRLLNRGFVKVEKYHAICFKKVKAQLPRRESERRSHPLARHCDVLSAIETRLSLLGMTYMKYVEMSLCCFIPGKVIDEIYRVLRFIQNNPNPPRVHELLQELRDISSMAMEYFEEKIAPSLKNKLSANSSAISGVSLSSASLSRSLPSTSSGSQVFATPRLNPFSEPDIKSNGLLKQMQTSQNTIKKELNDIKIKFKDFAAIKREMTSLKNRVKDSEKVSLEKDQTIAELKAELEDLKRRMNELDKKSGLKSIKDKDEQQMQKETKSSKRKTSPKSTKTSNKRRSNQSLELNTEYIEPIAVLVEESNGKRRRSLRCNSAQLNSRSISRPVEKPTPKPNSKTPSKRIQNNESNVGKRQKRLKTK